MNNFAQQKIHQKIRFAMAALVLAVGVMPSAALAGELAEQWVARYNGTANSSDWGYAATVDSRDNVIVTGPSTGNVNGVISSDTATIKYNARGKEVWVARDTGGSRGLDVAVDADDNVYVTNSYATIKYNAAGSLMWRVAEHGTTLAADAVGNVYVTGNLGTVKLDATGARQWLGAGGSAIALDAAGNVYVAGSTTVKLDPNNGQTLWSAPVGASGGRFPLVVDASGTVYVTGGNAALGNVTAKYDTNGNQLWMTSHSIFAEAIAADAAGNAYIVPSSSMAVSKFDSAVGNMLWTSSGTAGYAINLAVSDRGDVYVGGGDGGNDFVTVKFNSAGVQQATATYDNGRWDDVYDVVMDSRGNPIVIGESFSAVNSDFATVKYSR